MYVYVSSSLHENMYQRNSFRVSLYFLTVQNRTQSPYVDTNQALTCIYVQLATWYAPFSQMAANLNLFCMQLHKPN